MYPSTTTKALTALFLTSTILFGMTPLLSHAETGQKAKIPPSLAACYNTQGAEEKCLSLCQRASKSPNKTLTKESHFALCEEGCQKGKIKFSENYLQVMQEGKKNSCRKIQNSNRADLEASKEAQARGMNDSAKSAYKSGVNGYFWAARKLAK